MLVAIITIILIFGTIFLKGRANDKKTIKGYLLVLIGGVITFLFEPILNNLFINNSIDDGIIQTAIQLIARISGLYFTIWAIFHLSKFNKK